MKKFLLAALASALVMGGIVIVLVPQDRRRRQETHEAGVASETSSFAANLRTGDGPSAVSATHPRGSTPSRDPQTDEPLTRGKSNRTTERRASATETRLRAGDSGHSISGRVMDAGGVPVPGIIVNARRYRVGHQSGEVQLKKPGGTRTTTDPIGFYEISDVERGEYELSTVATEEYSATRTIVFCPATRSSAVGSAPSNQSARSTRAISTLIRSRRRASIATTSGWAWRTIAKVASSIPLGLARSTPFCASWM